MPIRVAMVQLTSSNNLDRNLKKMRVFLEQGARMGADLIAFPELVYFTGPPDSWQGWLGEYEKLLAHFASWAKEFGVFLLPGTLREPSANAKPYNTAVLLDRSGVQVAKYRKTHLFKAALADRAYDEAACYSSGDTLEVVDTALGKIGLTVCFDLRFPELFRKLKEKGADIVLVPSAFTVPTGESHWESLLRARAIDNQMFVLAPGQVGISGECAAKYGHSLAVDPWGRVLVDMKEDQGVEMVEIDVTKIEEARLKLEARASRRPELYE